MPENGYSGELSILSVIGSSLCIWRMATFLAFLSFQSFTLFQDKKNHLRFDSWFWIMFPLKFVKRKRPFYIPFVTKKNIENNYLKGSEQLFIMYRSLRGTNLHQIKLVNVFKIMCNIDLSHYLSSLKSNVKSTKLIFD